MLVASPALALTHMEYTLRSESPRRCGLVHGFGFAGALTELGLPSGGTVAALLAFDVGVELGQLVVVGVALVLAALARRALGPDARTQARWVAVYAIGLTASVWTVSRAFEL